MACDSAQRFAEAKAKAEEVLQGVGKFLSELVDGSSVGSGANGAIDAQVGDSYRQYSVLRTRHREASLTVAVLALTKSGGLPRGDISSCPSCGFPGLAGAVLEQQQVLIPRSQVGHPLLHSNGRDLLVWRRVSVYLFMPRPTGAVYFCPGICGHVCMVSIASQAPYIQAVLLRCLAAEHHPDVVDEHTGITLTSLTGTICHVHPSVLPGGLCSLLYQPLAPLDLGRAHRQKHSSQCAHRGYALAVHQRAGDCPHIYDSAREPWTHRSSDTHIHERRWLKEDGGGQLQDL